MANLKQPPSHLKALTRAEAARWAGRRVGLYGGSFNPGHEGHLHVAIEALKRLDLESVWFMVSPGNPLKDRSDMAPFDARFESARELADCHPKLHVSDIETRIDSRYTAETIALLTGLFPATRFVWMMGADNMQQFDQWHRWDDIMRLVPVAIFDRPAYTVGGFAGRMARQFARYQISPQKLLKATTGLPAWSFIRMPRHPASATEIRRRLGHEWLQRNTAEQSLKTLLESGG